MRMYTFLFFKYQYTTLYYYQCGMHPFCGIKVVFILSKNRITKPVDHFFTFCTPIVVVLHMSYRLCSYIIVQSFCYRVVLVTFVRKKEKWGRLEGERMLLKFI